MSYLLYYRGLFFYSHPDRAIIIEMEVIIIEPHCFCAGVNNALTMAYKAKKENPDKTIHILGSLVHNERVVKDLENDGFVILDEKKKTLDQWILSLEKGEVVVFSAHGHDPKLDILAKSKGLVVYDSTCGFVKANELLLKKKVETGGQAIYIGQKGHAEAKGALGISDKNIFLCESNKPFDASLVSVENPLLVSQTTMGLEEIKTATSTLLKDFPKAEISARVCDATEKRQNAISTAPTDIDLYVVMGSSTSNNTIKLFELAKSQYKNATILRVLDLEELKSYEIKGKKKAALVSGASTSLKEFNEIRDFLLKL